MQNITLHEAGSKDIEMIVDMRTKFGEELAGPQEAAITENINAGLKAYFDEELNNTCLCWYAAVDGKVASIACVVLRRQPGGIKNPSGRWGYFMNVFTLPQFRRKGLSAMIVNKLMEEAVKRGVTAFELHATKEGAPVYEKCGFVVHGEPTYRKFVVNGLIGY